MSSQPLRRSRRLASIIPASHWVSIGYSEDDAKLIEKLQNDMKNYCDGDGGETEIKLVCGYDVTDLSIMIPNGYILPHWKKLAKVLIGRTSVENVDLYGISLPTSVLDIILPAFQSMNLSRLYLCNVGLGSDGLLRLTSFLEENSSLKDLYFGGDSMGDNSIASSLSGAINSHPNLQVVVLVNCGLNINNDGALRIILKGCTKLGEGFSIGYEPSGLDVTVVEDFIRRNHPTKRIMIKLCNISVNDTLLLAAALNNNTNLEQLVLERMT